MSWLSELTGGIFLPLCCCTGWGSIEEGGITSCFYCSQPLLCPVTKPGIGTEVSLCVGGWWATKHESDRRTSACQVFGLSSVYSGGGGLPSYFLRGYSVNVWRVCCTRRCGSRKTEEQKKNFSWTLSVANSQQRPVLPNSSAIKCTSLSGSVFFTLPLNWGDECLL